MNLEGEGADAPALAYTSPDDDASSTPASGVASAPKIQTPPAQIEAGEGDDDYTDDTDIDLLNDDEDGTGDEPGKPTDADEEFEEIERAGKKYRIPAALKGELMMQADYTRKTQDIAQQRQELERVQAVIEQQRTILDQQAEFSRANVQKLAQFHTVNDQLAQYEQVDWQAWENKDPFEAQSHWRTYQQLEKQRNGLAHELHQAEIQSRQERERQNSETQQAARADLAKRAEKTLEVLKSRIPSWNEETATAVSQHALSMGFKTDELMAMTVDPRAFIALHDAMKYRQLLGKRDAAKAKAKAEAEVVAPLAPVPRGRSAPIPSGLSDELSAEEWAKRRNAQVHARRR